MKFQVCQKFSVNLINKTSNTDVMGDKIQETLNTF
jgi:hypothetical protein